MGVQINKEWNKVELTQLPHRQTTAMEVTYDTEHLRHYTGVLDHKSPSQTLDVTLVIFMLIAQRLMLGPASPRRGIPSQGGRPPRLGTVSPPLVNIAFWNATPDDGIHEQFSALPRSALQPPNIKLHIQATRTRVAQLVQ